MTAIAGFNCEDGIVIAADTEESYGPDNKVYTHKLFPFLGPKQKLAIAGAGSGYLIDYAKEKIVAAMDACTSGNEVEATLVRILDGLYSHEFTRFPVGSPSELAIQLLVAVQFVNPLAPGNWLEPIMFECQSNLVTRVQKHQSRIFGTGELLKELGSQFADWGLTTELAEWASLYVIHDAKRRFGGVGGRTHTFRLMNNGQYSNRPGSDVHLKEEVFDILTRTNQLLMLSLCPSITDSRAKDFVDAAKKWFSSARLHLKKIERDRKKVKHHKVVIDNSEMRKMMRKLAKGSVSRKPEAEE